MNKFFKAIKENNFEIGCGAILGGAVVGLVLAATVSMQVGLNVAFTAMAAGFLFVVIFGEA